MLYERPFQYYSNGELIRRLRENCTYETQLEFFVRCRHVMMVYAFRFTDSFPMAIKVVETCFDTYRSVVRETSKPYELLAKALIEELEHKSLPVDHTYSDQWNKCCETAGKLLWRRMSMKNRTAMIKAFRNPELYEYVKLF